MLMLHRYLLNLFTRPPHKPLPLLIPRINASMVKRKHSTGVAKAPPINAVPKVDETVLDPAAGKDVIEPSPQTKESNDEICADPEAEALDDDADPEEIKEALSRPPPVNSDYLPLPWKGRLGYACLCTYLRNSTPTVFQSRTTRIASILEHRHPLKDPTQPEHATKNRPDKEKPADDRLGQEFVEQLCLANCRDMIKMLRWNDKFNIKFLRLSSEAFPFASHAVYGYKLAPFASEALAEVGKVVAQLGHRVSTHPGQFTQLGSPNPQVIEASKRDLVYHDEMLSLLKLPEQQDRDAIMVLHMGGMYGDKQATLDRFRKNYATLPASVKNRLVLENDDVSWNVHDLLPICKELNIPLVLDFHHHNIIFDDSQVREGTADIMHLYPEIRATWTRKRITQKMHYSEPTPAAITNKQRRKHSPRVATLPPCPDDMDLMIEAKDKEQAVFELMRTFKLPGYETFNDIQPHIRKDDSRNGVDITDEEFAMGGPENRVYWPPGMEEWLRPAKRVVKKKDPAVAVNGKAKPVKKAAVGDNAAAEAPNADGESKPEKAVPQKKTKGRAKKADIDDLVDTVQEFVNGDDTAASKITPKTKSKPRPNKQNLANGSGVASKAKAKREPTLSPFSDQADTTEEDEEPPPKLKRGESSRKSSRARRGRVSYKEEDHEEDD